MPNLRREASGLIKVLCEFCPETRSSGSDVACMVCDGRRYFLWDVNSELCYAADGNPLMIADHEGNEVQLRRRPTVMSEAEATDINYLSVEDMLTFVGEWVRKKRTRKFKLWYEDGWNCYLWPHKFKADVIQSTHEDLSVCVRNCYERLLRHLHAGS